MKTILIFIISLSVYQVLAAKEKFILATEKPIVGINLINIKNGITSQLKPIKGELTTFVFEVENIDETLLKVASDVQVKIYSCANKLSTQWLGMRKEDLVSIKSLFEKNVQARVELETFLIKSFISTPITTTTGNLRQNSNFAFEQEMFSNFGKPENLSVAWTTDHPITELRINDVTNSIEIFKTKQTQINSIEYAHLPASVSAQLEKGKKYCLTITTKESAYQEEEHKLIFEFAPFYFVQTEATLIFASQEKILINWDTEGEAAKLSLWDESGKLVFHTLTKNTYLDSTDLKNIQLNTRKTYRLKLNKKGSSISKSFIVLFNKPQLAQFNE